MTFLACGGQSATETPAETDSDRAAAEAPLAPLATAAELAVIRNAILGERFMDYEPDQGDDVRPFNILNLKADGTFSATTNDSSGGPPKKISGKWSLTPDRNGYGEPLIGMTLESPTLAGGERYPTIDVNPDGTYLLTWYVGQATPAFYAKTLKLAGQYAEPCREVKCEQGSNARCVRRSEPVALPYSLSTARTLCLNDDFDGTPAGFLAVVKQNYFDPNPQMDQVVEYAKKVDATLPIPAEVRTAYNQKLEKETAARGPTAADLPVLGSFIAAGRKIYALRTTTLNAAAGTIISFDAILFDSTGKRIASLRDYNEPQANGLTTVWAD